MMIDYRKSTKVHLIGLHSGNIEAVLIIYGLQAHEVKKMCDYDKLHELVANKKFGSMTTIDLIESGDRAFSRRGRPTVITRGNQEALF